MRISYENWGLAEEKLLTKALEEKAEKDFAEFNRRMIPSALPITGVRTAKLRNLAKEIVKNGPVKSYLDYYTLPDSVEKALLYGIVLGISDIPFDELLDYTRKFLPTVENWAVCDMTACGLKKMSEKENFKSGYAFACECVQDKYIWSYRFGLVLMFRYFLCDECIDEILFLIENSLGAGNDEYYAVMGTAWFLSEAYLRYPEKIMYFTEQADIPKQTVQKGLQKIIESNRVSKEDKEIIRAKKKKLKQEKRP